MANCRPPVGWVLATLMLASIGLWYGWNLRSASDPSHSDAWCCTGRANTPKAPSTPIIGGSQVTHGTDTAGIDGSAILVPGTSEVYHLKWVPVLSAFLLLASAFWVLTRRPTEIIQDSRHFTEALEIWQPIIGQQYRTPREIKRFLNRIRYIAMRWRRPSVQKPKVRATILGLVAAKNHPDTARTSCESGNR